MFFDEIVFAQKRGEAKGIPSICSAHPWVLKAAMQKTLKVSETFGVLLIEATCNQVNQFGGYTGMTPADFVRFMRGIAAENGLPPERLILGGDHLGPLPWQEETAECAMQKAAEMVQSYVQAGFVKIHLDASMKLGNDDPTHPLDVEHAAARAAWLAKAAEETLAKVSDPPQGLRYVIGAEVPIPGGATAHEDGLRVTTVEDARRTLEVTREAFLREGLEAAWERVIALVVQPGVEFGDDFVLDYNPEAACDLVRFSETMPFVYEAHSTDYQTRENLRNLVRDHFAILKVGPALTFAFREAIFALAHMEDELFPVEERSNLMGVLEKAMQREPSHWKNHYRGADRQLAFARKYSLSDRARYYWLEPAVQAALEKLLANLGSSPIPLTLLSQFAPVQWRRIRTGQIRNSPPAVILDRIKSVLVDYAFACE
jgi:D-tagatose-1,6-bisphosphate aldolase subunit GatZ/KbaZ